MAYGSLGTSDTTQSRFPMTANPITGLNLKAKARAVDRASRPRPMPTPARKRAK